MRSGPAYDDAQACRWLIPAGSENSDDPITLPGGRQLVTLEDAANYIMELLEADQATKEWMTATQILIGTAEGRDFLMHARIGMMKALYPNLRHLLVAMGAGPAPSGKG